MPEGTDAGCTRKAAALMVMRLKITKGIVIPKRGLFARGICFFAAGSKQIPRRINLASE
jgi:hypothetical protein